MKLFGFSVRVSLFFALCLSGNATDLDRNCICNNNVCKAVFKFSSTFQTSKQLCEDMGGQLMTLPSKATSDHLTDLLVDLREDFWIGLRLPDGQCTDVNSPLKGYIWTSDLQTTEFTNWRDDEIFCTPRCVSVSVDLKWTEKSCQNHSSGFLCENVPEDSCYSFTLEKPKYSKVFHDRLGCLAGICEHKCHVESDSSFRCSCFSGFVINKAHQMFCVDDSCTSERCSPRCVYGTTSCSCDDGYIINETECVDMNECAFGYCDHHCFNALGSYECSCKEGFRLVDKDKCVKTDTSTDHIPNRFLTPSLNYTMGHASVGAPGKFIGVIVVVLIGIVAVIFFVRYWTQKQNEPSGLLSDGDCVQDNVA